MHRAYKTRLAGMLLPLSVAVSMLAFFTARAQGANLELVLTVTTVGILLLAIAAERLQPFRPDWNRSQGDTLTDLTSAGVLAALVDPLLKYFGPILMVGLYAYLPLTTETHALAALPFALQLTVVILLVEFMKYWLHRLHHAQPGLWWLHAMHHSSRRLYALNNLRFHPLNYSLNVLGSLLPLMLLGAPAELILAYLAFSQPVVMWQHANLDARHGLLNYLFSTNELHRWHHSTVSHEANRNYGNAIMLWDLVFRTFRYHKVDNAPHQVGLFSGSAHYPASASYWRQLSSMFSPVCCGAGDTLTKRGKSRSAR